MLQIDAYPIMNMTLDSLKIARKGIAREENGMWNIDKNIPLFNFMNLIILLWLCKGDLHSYRNCVQALSGKQRRMYGLEKY